MTVLQIGMPKSGNFWLYNILKQILIAGGQEWRSFVTRQPAYLNLSELDLSVNEQASIDVIDVREDGYSWRISSVQNESIPEIDPYLEQCSLVWTHSDPCATTAELVSKVNKIVYICRDPRDVLMSMAHFVMSDYMKSYHKDDSGSAEDFISENYTHIFKRWAKHVSGHLPFVDQDHFYFLFYEDLKKDPVSKIKALADFLEIGLSEAQVLEIRDSTSFDSMKVVNPGHLRKGKSGGWKETLEESYASFLTEHFSPLLDALNYPLSRDMETAPSLRENIDIESLLTYSRPAPKKTGLKKYRKGLRYKIKKIFG